MAIITAEKLKERYTAGNWSVADDSFSKMFLLQNLKQFWLPEEVALANDLLTWKSLTPEEQFVYKSVLGGLTLLDTIQGDIGMPSIMDAVESHQQKAVLSFMGAMENAVHARSYSNIFMTLAPQKEIDEVFEWIENNEYLQRKAEIIVDYYEQADVDTYSAMVASVALESFLFYSGFFYPLYLAGQGKLRASGDIISLIIRDEAIHGVYVGLLSQKKIESFENEHKENITETVFELFDRLLENEIAYTRSLYDGIGLTLEVIDFLKYNANKALMNLGYEARYEHDPVNPIVMNGLVTDTTAIDFFSEKGTMYKKATVEAIRDEDFVFDNVNDFQTN
ncbi:class 1b ribonucleoside-diphosphate reductase subunit beta [Macrococcus capreoli]|uniref:class 1b ribonucleoside-diphosphate reductase subunit beta n=1 Tax=Macrococcus capreoli TaxID=2982690 RepID=UPI0021D5B50B|nr:class 1b ribonucleoside-diphosphate reductase subunit beta [Macrococcus sp. TMW 2.2395]MCU7556566.1 class 1b ribonucleoside-diphosphate reductase subunit beta [Macrococcus sp. TMW 2.2395]